MYNNTVSRLIDIANISPKDTYNILTFPTHERYETSLCKTGHQFYALNIDKMKKWNVNQTPIPTNYHILPTNQICDYLNYDFILVQSKFGQFQVANQINQQLNIPIICLEHTMPIPSVMQKSQIDQMRSMKGNINIFISEFSKNMWQLNGLVINHGVDTNTFAPKNEIQNNKTVLTVANDFKNRDYCLNYSGWSRITDGLQTRLVGNNEGISESAKSIDELVKEYNMCGVYLNTSTFSPIPTSLLEAMSCGCAVVSTATCMIPEIIKNGENGFISNDEAELKNYINTILQNPDLATKLGSNARETIIQQFSENQFINKWNQVFKKIYEESTK